jgi:hypothetical protein
VSGTVALASDVLLYHPARGSTPLLLARSTHDGPTHTSYNSPLVLREIPSARVCDGAFCYMLHRASVLNDTRCTATAVYETRLWPSSHTVYLHIHYHILPHMNASTLLQYSYSMRSFRELHERRCIPRDGLNDVGAQLRPTRSLRTRLQ